MDDSRGLSHWDLLPPIGLAALAALSLHLWPSLPDPVPTHWGAQWRPNGWMPKSVLPWFMFGLPTFLWVFIGIVGTIAAPSDEARAALQARSMAPLRGLLSFGACFLMSLLVAIPTYGPMVFWPAIGAFLILVAMGVAFMARSVQRHMPAELRGLYKWGLFYCNPADPRLWVEKLIGVGWTLNFARPAAWAVMAALLALPFAAVVAAALAK